MSEHVVFYHVRNVKNLTKGGATFAIEVDEADVVNAFAKAKCSIGDNFCRRLGRVKAEGRLNSSKYRTAIRGGVTIKEMILWLKQVGVDSKGALVFEAEQPKEFSTLVN